MFGKSNNPTHLLTAFPYLTCKCDVYDKLMCMISFSKCIFQNVIILPVLTSQSPSLNVIVVSMYLRYIMM